MGQSWAIFRDGGSGLRLRSAKDGYNPMDLGLSRQLVTFDSSWLNSFRVRASNDFPGSNLADGTQTVGPATRQTKVIPIGGSGPDRLTLAWMKNYGGNLTEGASSVPYVRGYGMCSVSMTDAEIHISPRKPGMGYVYYVFSVDGTNPEGSGAGGGLIGNHPSYGPGLYIARPGVSPLSAGLDDMMLTTRRNHFQVQQTGMTGAATRTLNDDPFPLLAPSVVRQGYVVNLGRSYPDYPPVIAVPTNFAASGGATDRHQCSVFWLSSSQLLILSSFDPASPVRWAVLTNNAGYSPEPPGPEVIRVACVTGGGLYVTKKGISFPSAGAGDFLFRSDRQTPQFVGFGPIPTGITTTGITTQPLPGSPPSSGIPFTFFMAYWNAVTGWWCGCGAMLTADFVNAGAYYGPAFAAVSISSTQYKWYNDASLSSGYFGRVATMNVSDF